jgi:hypothetical protein
MGSTYVCGKSILRAQERNAALEKVSPDANNSYDVKLGPLQKEE